MTGTEEWRPVVGWEGLYEVSSLGRVRSLDRTQVQRNRWGDCQIHYKGRLVSGPISNRNGLGYRRVSLSHGKRKTLQAVHVMVAAAFIGPRPEGAQVAHGDGNPLNNAASNLRYATPAQNEEDKTVHGTHAKGIRNPAAKIGPAEVTRIRQLRGLFTQSEIAAEFGIDQTTVSLIQLRRLWPDVA